MGFMKKLARALSLDSKNKRAKSKNSQNTNYLNAERLSAAANNPEQRGPSRYSEQGSRSYSEQRPPGLQLEHVRNGIPDTPRSVEQQCFDAPNIQELRDERSNPELQQNVFIRPATPNGQPKVAKSSSPALAPSTPERMPPAPHVAAVSQTPTQSPQEKSGVSRTKPTVALTVLIDTAVTANKAHIKDISVGILKLLLALSPEDTISIFGYDEQGASGLFTFEAQKENYADIMKLILDLHTSTPQTSAKKLNDAIVMVVEELSNLNPDDLKPFIIMADDQVPEHRGQPFEAQHALLWGSAQNLQPIFVSVWDSEIFNDIKPFTSKHVHMDSLSSTDISGATLVIQAYLKEMMQEHKRQMAAKEPPLPTFIADLPQLGSDVAGPSSPSGFREQQLHRDLSQIPTLPAGLPPISERSNTESWADRSSARPSLQRTSVASIASEVDPRPSEFDSTVNAGTSSAGTVDRDNLNVADFGDDLVKESKEEGSGNNLAAANEFRGFPHATESLFLDSDGSERSLADIVRHRRNQSKASSAGASAPAGFVVG